MDNHNDNSLEKKITNKAELVEQMVEMALCDPNLSEQELDDLCDYLEKEGRPEVREEAMERYWQRHPLSEENVKPDEAEVRRGWAEVAAKMGMNPDIDHYRKLYAEREAAKLAGQEATEEIWQETKRESRESVPATPVRRTLPLWQRRAMRVAAVLIPAAMIVGGFFLWDGVRDTADTPAMVATTGGAERAKFEPTQTVSSENNGIRQITLADGTEVTLNHNSTFAYNDNREGELKGEAWFNVAKDAEHPFVIHSDELTVTVLGTQFNFNTDTDSGQSALSLYEGVVKLDYEGGSDRLNVAGREFTLGHATGKAEIRDFDTGRQPEWLAAYTTSRIMPLDAIFRSIASAYGVTIENAQAIDLTEEYSFRIASGESIENILTSLQVAGGAFEFTINEDTVRLSPKR